MAAGAFDVKFTAKQSRALQSEATEILYGGAAGGGKALALDTPIPTPGGWSTMGELKAGDLVLGSSGRPTMVLGATEIMRGRPCFRVAFDDGEEIVADAEHLWDTFTAADLAALTRCTEEYRAKRRANRPSRISGNKSGAFAAVIALRNTNHRPQIVPPPIAKTRSTKEIAETLRTRSGRANHAIRNATAIDLPAVDLPIDPYILGAWLGDGTSVQGSITMAPEDAIHITPHIEAAGYSCRKRSSSPYAYGVIGLLVDLRPLGLLGNKHVPPEYLRASAAQRLALLQGLMDTDGTVARHSGVCQFTNTNERLADAVLELACSLGWKPTKREGRAKLRGKDCGAKWTVCFMASEPAFRLPRKLALQKLSTRRTTGFRYIVSCESCESVPVRCIQVDAPDSLYLAGRRMVPTHNSYFMRALAIILCGLIPGLNVYLFRRIYDDLIKNHMEGTGGFPVMLAPLIASGHVKIVAEEIRFWNGSRIFLCHCEHDKHRFKYQGAEIHVLLIDELTMFTEVVYRFLRGRLRAPNLAIPQWAIDFFQAKFGVQLTAKIPLILAGSNPGNIGHGWVKSTFIDGVLEFATRRMSPAEGGMLRQYIPARLEDNPHIDAEDYEGKLAGLGTKELVRAMRYGDWNIVAGAFFDNISEEKHKLPSFTPPKHWTRFRSFDWGSARPFSVIWWTIAESEWVNTFKDGKERMLPQGALVAYREWYGVKTDENGQVKANEGLRLSAQAVGRGIKEREAGETIDEAMSRADPSLWKEDGGPSNAENMLKCDPKNPQALVGPRFQPADNTRQTGWQQMYSRLAWEGVDDGEPMLYITEDCQNWWRTVPALQHDEHRPEDIDSDMEDHAADSTRYGVMGRPISRIPKPKQATGPKPWTLDWLDKQPG